MTAAQSLPADAPGASQGHAVQLMGVPTTTVQMAPQQFHPWPVAGYFPEPLPGLVVCPPGSCPLVMPPGAGAPGASSEPVLDASGRMQQCSSTHTLFQQPGSMRLATPTPAPPAPRQAAASGSAKHGPPGTHQYAATPSVPSGPAPLPCAGVPSAPRPCPVQFVPACPVTSSAQHLNAPSSESLPMLDESGEAEQEGAEAFAVGQCVKVVGHGHGVVSGIGCCGYPDKIEVTYEDHTKYHCEPCCLRPVFKVGKRVEVLGYGFGTISGIGCCGYPEKVEVTYDDGTKYHCDPQGLRRVRRSEALALPKQQPQHSQQPQQPQQSARPYPQLPVGFAPAGQGCGQVAWVPHHFLVGGQPAPPHMVLNPAYAQVQVPGQHQGSRVLQGPAPNQQHQVQPVLQANQYWAGFQSAEAGASEGQASSGEDADEALAMGHRVDVPGYGCGTVSGIGCCGHAGKIEVTYEDGTKYHCKPTAVRKLSGRRRRRATGEPPRGHPRPAASACPQPIPGGGVPTQMCFVPAVGPHGTPASAGHLRHGQMQHGLRQVWAPPGAWPTPQLVWAPQPSVPQRPKSAWQGARRPPSMHVWRE